VNLRSGSAEWGRPFHLAVASAPGTGAGRSDGEAEGAQSLNLKGEMHLADESVIGVGA